MTLLSNHNPRTTTPRNLNQHRSDLYLQSNECGGRRGSSLTKVCCKVSEVRVRGKSSGYSLWSFHWTGRLDHWRYRECPEHIVYRNAAVTEATLTLLFLFNPPSCLFMTIYGKSDYFCCICFSLFEVDSTELCWACGGDRNRLCIHTDCTLDVKTAWDTHTHPLSYSLVIFVYVVLCKVKSKFGVLVFTDPNAGAFIKSRNPPDMVMPRDKKLDTQIQMSESFWERDVILFIEESYFLAHIF